MSKLMVVASLIFSFPLVKAQSTSGQFEVVDLTGSILGEADISADAAKISWNRACLEWKKETKELNNHSQLLGINCNIPDCTYSDSGKTQCSSTGTYQIKTAGVRNEAPAPAPVVVAPPVQREIVTVQAPPQIIVERVESPRFDVLWIPGFWGRGHHHHRTWHNGYWHHRW